MISALIISMRRRAASEDGVIALATLAFMIAAGMAVIVLLWSIGVVTGAYNSLYAANQAAAYAAASATQAPTTSDSSSQLSFQCSYSGDPTLCTGGASYDAATSVMRTMLNPNRPGDFNLNYGANVSMSLRAYSIGRTAHQAEAQAAAYGCPINPSDGAGYTPLDGNPYQNSLNCWQLEENGLRFPVQYTSAVVAKSDATVNVMPGCTLSFCTQNIEVIAAASQDQPNPYTCYSEYYGTTCSARQPTPPSPPASPVTPTKPRIIPMPASGKCPTGYRKQGRRFCVLK